MGLVDRLSSCHVIGGPFVLELSGMEVTLASVHVGCNLGNHSISRVSTFHPHLVAYTADVGIAIYNTQTSRIQQTLYHRRDVPLTVVEWEENYIFTGDSQGWFIIWDTQSWSVVLEYQFSSAITSIAASNPIVLIAARHGLHVFQRFNQWTYCTSIIVKDTLQCLDIQPIDSSILIAAGGISTDIHLFRFVAEELLMVGTLTGHMGWITSLAFQSMDRHAFCLASASQDAKIRLWTFTTEERCYGLECTIALESSCFRIYKECVLMDHGDWVTSVHWMDNQLVSASMDNTIIVWTKSPEDIWISKSRVGEMGGNGVGIQSVCILEQGLLALGHVHHQLHRWNWVKEMWQRVPTVTGHYEAVMDMTWSPDSQYLLTCSMDHTVRLWAEMHGSWHEVSRVQNHGYPMKCLDCIATGPGQLHMISGGDENVLRVYAAPTLILEKLYAGSTSPVYAAYIQELGLTTKSRQDPILEQWDVPTNVQLGQYTCWPETNKLIGHGNEMLSVTTSPSSAFVVSTCKARLAQFASLWVWDTRNWTVMQKLNGPTSSVVHVAFSPDEQWIAAACKDRHVVWYRRTSDIDAPFVLHQRTKGHKRILWKCSWSSASNLLATGSRDQTVKLWKENEQGIWVEVGK